MMKHSGLPSFVIDYNEKFNIENKKAVDIYKRAVKFLKNKKSSEIDTNEVRYLKGLIRKGEARATCHFVGIPDEQIHFMELPFYETGAIKKNPIGILDVKITTDLIENIKPIKSMPLAIWQIHMALIKYV